MFVLEVENLTKRFGDIIAVNNLSLKLEPGVIYGLLGPNGAGKSTFIHLLMRLYKPHTGVIKIFGHDMKKRNLNVLRKIGFMPQDVSLYYDLTPMENAFFFGRLYGMPDEKIAKRANELFSFLKLEEKKDKVIRTLSGGQRRRASLGIALLHEPELLILDEPTVGVDPLLRREFWNYFFKLRDEGKTIIVSTHIMDEAMRVDKVGLMSRGRIFEEGSPQELLKKYHTETLEDLFFTLKEMEAKQA